MSPAAPIFVGGETCRSCHEQAYLAWRGSDHDRAMAVASEETVLGDFNDAVFDNGEVTARFFRRDGGFFVATQGPGGAPGEFKIAYTFGVEPLQQYLIPFPGGRLQALTIAWDTERHEWFHLYPDQDIPPDDWLHWTRGGQTELERHVRRVPFDEPDQGLRRRNRDVLDDVVGDQRELRGVSRARLTARRMGRDAAHGPPGGGEL
jgi:hypothetical protein